MIVKKRHKLFASMPEFPYGAVSLPFVGRQAVLSTAG